MPKSPSQRIRMSSSKIDVKGTGAVLLAVLITSTIILFLKYFTVYIDAWTANGLRYSMVVLIYLPWLLFARRRGFFNRRTVKLALVPAGFNLLHQVFWAFTPYFVDAGIIGFLVRISTLWAIIGSFIFFSDERLLLRSFYFWAGVIFNIAGFTGIVIGGNHTLSGTTTIGILLILICSILWAGYNISVRHFFRETDPKTAFGTVASLTYPGLFLLMFSVGNPSRVWAAPSYILPLILISGILGLAIKHVLIYTAIKRLGVSITATVGLSSSFITALLANLLFAESLTRFQWAGGAVLVLGSGILIWAQKDFVRNDPSENKG